MKKGAKVPVGMWERVILAKALGRVLAAALERVGDFKLPERI